MRRFALVAVAVSLSAGLWAPRALGATDSQPSGEPAVTQPGQGTQGEPAFHHRGHRGPGMNGEQPQDGQRWGGQGNGQDRPERPRWGGQGNGQDRPERPRWGGQGNDQPPQNGSSRAPGLNGEPSKQGDGSTGDGQRSHGQWSGPRGHHHGRPGPNGSSETDGPTQ